MKRGGRGTEKPLMKMGMGVAMAAIIFSVNKFSDFLDLVYKVADGILEDTEQNVSCNTFTGA